MSSPGTTDPSPDEITALCLAIQAGWPPDERHRRLRVDLRPVVRCADGRLVSVTADAYEAHTNETPLAMLPADMTFFF